MKIFGENVFGISNDWMEAEVPGSVYGNLLKKGLMPNPYDRMNELDALKLMENDFSFRTTFLLAKEQLAADGLLLRFDGVDTLSDIYLNDIFLGHTDNMHRVGSMIFWRQPGKGRTNFGCSCIRRQDTLPKRMKKFIQAVRPNV